MKIQKLALTALTIGALGFGILSNEAHAVLIVGDIQFAGRADLNGNTLTPNPPNPFPPSPIIPATAVEAGGFTSVTVSSTSGDFSVVPNSTPVTYTPLQWNFNSGAIANFWTVGGFTFDLTSSAVQSQSGSFLEVTGNGFVRSTNPLLDLTPAFYTFSISSADGATTGNVYGFSASTATRGVGVPEGGSALALLGMAFAGIELARRKLAARR